MDRFGILAAFVLSIGAAATVSYVAGLSSGRELFEPEPRQECPEIDTDAQMVLLMDECERCKDGEAKNWEDAQYKRIDQLEKCEEKLSECLFFKKIYERQNHEWADGACNLDAKTTCGPFEWTCEEALFHAAIAERAYNVCAYGGFFPGYTMMDGWLDDTREKR